MKNNRKRKKKNNRINVAIGIAISIIIVLGIGISIKKYAPTKERMELGDFFKLKYKEEAAVIFNGQYDPKEEISSPRAIIINNMPFIELSFIKDNIDDTYVYDKEEKVLRYVTEAELISANTGEIYYSSGRENVDFSADIIIEKDYGTYINSDFVMQFSDITVSSFEEPNRVLIETAGTKKTMANLTKNTALRRFGGPKSLILKDCEKNDQVWVLEDYGKWSNVLTADGVIGCVKNNAISKTEDTTVEKRLNDREYTHNLLDTKIKLGWHQVINPDSNGNIDKILSNAGGINVVSPTWYRMSDNQGNISNISSQAYVNKCHSQDIEVWALVSNFEIEGVDTTSVLNRTSTRDNLVNNIVAAAITDNVDGINVDFESLSIEAKDGFIEFIRELSLKCKNNDLILSVANYKPEAHTQFYNRLEQAKFADYIVVMAYDEYHGDSAEAGSTASLPFVKESVEDTLKEVPKEQLLVGLPFYTRIWTQDGENITNRAIGMKGLSELISSNNAEKIWLQDEEQYYAKFEEEGKPSEVWIEDEESLSRKLAFVKNKDIAGVCFWRLGLEQSSVWEAVSNYVN